MHILRYTFISEYTKLMVIGGFNGSSMDSVEVIDLNDSSNKTCEAVSDYPLSNDYLTAQVVDGVVKACGGLYAEYDCYDYDPSSGTWNSIPQLNSAKDQARSSIIDGTYLVSGDYDNYQTEMWTGSEFVSGPDLPEVMYAHCQVTINATHVFFVDYEDKTAYLLD